MQRANSKVIKLMNNFDELLEECAERRRNEEKEGDIYLEDRTITGDNKNRKRNENQLDEEETTEELERLCSQWKAYR